MNSLGSLSLGSLNIGQHKATKVLVRPSVIIEILNSFNRRDERQIRVIGTLLGVTKGNTVEISDCYVVPHHEKTDEAYVAINKDYHNSMLSFKRQLNKQERVIGWFSTIVGEEFVSDNCSLIHEFYSHECAEPIHLVVNTNVKGAKHMEIRSYVSKPLIVGTQGLANVFQELETSLDFSTESEIQCIYHMIRTQTSAWSAPVTVAEITSAQENLDRARRALLTSIESAATFLEQEKDSKKHQKIQETVVEALNMLSAVSKEEVEGWVQAQTSKLSMLQYVVALTQTQLVISEKLNAIL